MVALSEAQRKANDKYIQNNYKQVKLSMPNAEAETLDQYCKDKQLTKADLLDKQLKKKWNASRKRNRRFTPIFKGGVTYVSSSKGNCTR